MVGVRVTSPSPTWAITEQLVVPALKSATVVSVCVSVTTPVVKVQVALVPSWLPFVSATVPATVTVYCVVDMSGALGVRVATPPVYVTTAATTFDELSCNWNVELLMVVAFIGLLNVTITLVPTGTLVAPGAGDCAVMTGGVVSIPETKLRSTPESAGEFVGFVVARFA